MTKSDIIKVTNRRLSLSLCKNSICIRGSWQSKMENYFSYLFMVCFQCVCVFEVLHFWLDLSELLFMIYIWQIWYFLHPHNTEPDNARSKALFLWKNKNKTNMKNKNKTKIKIKMQNENQIKNKNQSEICFGFSFLFCMFVYIFCIYLYLFFIYFLIIHIQF